jgi:hypothetical protein
VAASLAAVEATAATVEAAAAAEVAEVSAAVPEVASTPAKSSARTNRSKRLEPALLAASPHTAARSPIDRAEAWLSASFASFAPLRSLHLPFISHIGTISQRKDLDGLGLTK